MSERLESTAPAQLSNVLPFPVLAQASAFDPTRRHLSDDELPQYKKILLEAEALDTKSKYPCSFDYSIYRNLEVRYKDKPIRGGIAKKAPMKLVNSHATCQQCLYSFEIDTYGRGCVHNCVYCYAKAELTVHGMWNNPVPVPIDINEVRHVFYTVFETERPSRWRAILGKKIPLRIGCMSDSFMWMDQKFKVTQELLKILAYYNYPFTIFTRSDLVAHDDYMALIDPKLASIQFSISSINDELNRKIEPGAPSSARRLAALTKLNQAGYWTTARINPLFPVYPDGYFTNPNFTWEGKVPEFNYTNFDMVAAIAETRTPAIIGGFGRFSAFALNNIKKVSGHDLRTYFDKNLLRKSPRDFHYSDAEIRHYYEEFKRRCDEHKIQFTTCYIGNGENHFWDNRDLWSNKTDCCAIKGNVPSFKTDSREVLFADRLKFTTHKDAKPLSERLHEPLINAPKPTLKIASEVEKHEPPHLSI